MPSTDLLPVETAVALSGVSGAAFRKWWRMDPNSPAKIKSGRRVFFRRAEVEQWLARRMPR